MIGSSNGSRLRIETPEGIAFSYELASPLLRMYALIVDGICVSALSYLARRFALVLNLILDDAGTAFLLLAMFAIMWGYYILTEWIWDGQSIGKKLLRLRVMDARGFRLTFDQIVLRNLMRAVDVLPVAYLVGGLVAFFNSHHQRLGDLLGGTVVIHERRRPRPDVSNLLGDDCNSFIHHPHLIYRARTKIRADEAALLLNAILRRDELDPDSRLSVYASLTSHFKSRVPFPDENLSDERYLRNYAHVLFNR